MKSYTDIEQSKKLSEILPIETADMFHFIHEVDTVGFGYKKDAEEFYSKTKFEYLPCWSLAALLNIISYPTLEKRLSGWRCASNNRERKVYLVGEADNNPINVCYKMILRLHELNLL